MPKCIQNGREESKGSQIEQNLFRNQALEHSIF